MKKIFLVLLSVIFTLSVFGQQPYETTPDTVANLGSRKAIRDNINWLIAHEDKTEPDSTIIELRDGANQVVFYDGVDPIGPYFPPAYRDNGDLTINIQTGDNYAPDTTDKNGPIIFMSSASLDTVTVGTVATEGWSVGSYLTITAWAKDSTLIAPASGVTFNSSSDSIFINAVDGIVSLIMRTANSWLLIGTKE